MKKGTLIKSAVFFLSFILLFLIYLWIYIFPSVRKVNTLKRDVREFGVKIENAKSEESIFRKGDQRENLLFEECDSLYAESLQRWENESITFESALRQMGEKSGVYRLKISTEGEEDINSSDPDQKVVKKDKIDLDFIAGLRYGAEFIRVLQLSGQYILVKNIVAERRGASYHFKVIVEHLYTGEELLEPGRTPIKTENELIDMNSPLLKRPVYLSPLKIKRSNRGSRR